MSTLQYIVQYAIKNRVNFFVACIIDFGMGKKYRKSKGQTDTQEFKRRRENYEQNTEPCRAFVRVHPSGTAIAISVGTEIRIYSKMYAVLHCFMFSIHYYHRRIRAFLSIPVNYFTSRRQIRLIITIVLIIQQSLQR